ncbi:MAG: DNA-3-methyladenine glycosylase I [Patescibacteria group bacterium]|nr:MAG: DNA-3-methyladenine glycosylase I [Patescibacteria group bacterium]
MKTAKKRCTWPGEDPLMIRYHDEQWGKPEHDDKKHFEAFILDANQAGLSWRTILYKRENFRKAFANFDFNKVATFTKKDFNRLMKDKGIIRNRMKVEAAIVNARKFLEIRKEFGTFDKYIWSFVGGKTIRNAHKKNSDIGATSKESDAMSKDLKKRGFKFVGSTICYAYMQGVGMVDDHLTSCFRHKKK